MHATLRQVADNPDAAVARRAALQLCVGCGVHLNAHSVSRCVWVTGGMASWQTASYRCPLGLGMFHQHLVTWVICVQCRAEAAFKAEPEAELFGPASAAAIPQAAAQHCFHCPGLQGGSVELSVPVCVKRQACCINLSVLLRQRLSFYEAVQSQPCFVLQVCNQHNQQSFASVPAAQQIVSNEVLELRRVADQRQPQSSQQPSEPPPMGNAQAFPDVGPQTTSATTADDGLTGLEEECACEHGQLMAQQRAAADNHHVAQKEAELGPEVVDAETPGCTVAAAEEAKAAVTAAAEEAEAVGSTAAAAKDEAYSDEPRQDAVAARMIVSAACQHPNGDPAGPSFLTRADTGEGPQPQPADSGIGSKEETTAEAFRAQCDDVGALKDPDPDVLHGSGVASGTSASVQVDRPADTQSWGAAAADDAASQPAAQEPMPEAQGFGVESSTEGSDDDDALNCQAPPVSQSRPLDDGSRGGSSSDSGEGGPASASSGIEAAATDELTAEAPGGVKLRKKRFVVDSFVLAHHPRFRGKKCLREHALHCPPRTKRSRGEE